MGTTYTAATPSTDVIKSQMMFGAPGSPQQVMSQELVDGPVITITDLTENAPRTSLAVSYQWQPIDGSHLPSATPTILLTWTTASGQSYQTNLSGTGTSGFGSWYGLPPTTVTAQMSFGNNDTGTNNIKAFAELSALMPRIT
jgi:hypothetical protein